MLVPDTVKHKLGQQLDLFLTWFANGPVPGKSEYTEFKQIIPSSRNVIIREHCTRWSIHRCKTHETDSEFCRKLKHPSQLLIGYFYHISELKKGCNVKSEILKICLKKKKSTNSDQCRQRLLGFKFLMHETGLNLHLLILRNSLCRRNSWVRMKLWARILQLLLLLQQFLK